MNEQFKDYVKSGAFSLSLSQRMINILLYLAGRCEQDEHLNLAPYLALQRRGLAEHISDKGFVITKEGCLVAELLSLAGYSSRNPPAHSELKTKTKAT